MLGALTLVMILAPAPLETADEPMDLSGNWGWEWKDEEGVLHKHILEVKKDPTGYVAVERFDDEAPVPVKNIIFAGQSIEIEIMRGIRTSSYKGKFVDANTIQGEVSVSAGGNTNVSSWTANRVVDKPDPS